MTIERTRDGRGLAAILLRPPSPPFAFSFALCAITASVVTGIWLFGQHRILSGPGDQLLYYAQAADLLPFKDHYYGPGYFVAIRVVHDLFDTDWLTAGKTVAFVSSAGILMVSALIFRRVLTDSKHWLALGLLALTPDLVMQWYSDLTIGFGALWLLGAIAVTIGATVSESRRWIFGGLMFGLASLVRFQAFGFLLGAVLGVLLLSGTWLLRVRAATLLLVFGIFPIFAWQVFLMLTQGSVPTNWNFIALTMATGEFERFADVPSLLDKYDTFWGLLGSDPMLVPKLVISAGLEAVRFPTGVGARMFGPSILWLGPGLIAGLFERRFWSPWAMALTAGFLITAPTQPGWTYYFVPMLPLLLILMIWGVELPDRSVRPSVVGASWFVLIMGTLVWSIHRVPRDFAAVDWEEQAIAQDFLNRDNAEERVVSSSSETISYRARFRFIDFDRIQLGQDNLNFVSALRSAGVTHLVVTARHSLFTYPSHIALLSDSLTGMPDGLRRDTLIIHPHRLAIFRILP